MGFDFSSILDSMALTLEDYHYLNQLLNHRTIVFNEEVDSAIIEKVYLPLKDFEEDSDMTPVTLILNSPGGSVSDGFFLAHYLAHYQKKLNIIVCGYAESMATVILAGGGKNPNVTRVCYPSTYALIHDGYITLSASESRTADDILEFNKRVDRDIRQFILDNTEITPEQYDSKARQQWFLSAEDMLKYNLIDEIIGVDPE